jgi:hypothetical protein
MIVSQWYTDEFGNRARMIYNAKTADFEAPSIAARRFRRRDVLKATLPEAQLPSGQVRDAEEKAKSSREGATKAVRNAWSHVLYPIKSDATAAGLAFDLEQSSITAKDRLQSGHARARIEGLYPHRDMIRDTKP